MSAAAREGESPSAGKLWWAIPAAGFLLLMAAAMLLGKQEEVRRGTSYDASNRGFRAAYLVLESLDYPVARSKRPAGGSSRWVLFPNERADDSGLESWVQDGGILVLAVDTQDFGRDFGLDVRVRKATEDPGEQAAEGGGISTLAGGKITVEGPGRMGKVWAQAGGQPAVTVYRIGRGEVWLLNRPEFVSNANLKKADNAVLLCRIADELQRRRPGSMAFDEFVHGMRDRPGVVELLLEPPMLWISLQSLALLGMLLWHFMPRFGTLRPMAPVRRRSKEEFLDAMASLLERKGDSREAYGTARDELVRDLERELGLPAGTPWNEIVRETVRRRRVSETRLRRVLDEHTLQRSGPGKAALVKALNELESVRDECFPRRHAR